MSENGIVAQVNHVNNVEYANKGLELDKIENDGTSSSSEDECDEKAVQKPPKSKICIDNSNDVVIGPVTQIHGPITIHQTVPQINNHVQNVAEEKPPGK